jgi:hypothetical protein
MTYSTHLCLLLATLSSTTFTAPTPELSFPDVLAAELERLLQLVQTFREQPVTPRATCHFEQRLQGEVRELARRVTQWAFNHLEPVDSATLPRHVIFENCPYTRLPRPTPTTVATLCGNIRLWRVGYRPTHKTGDPAVFPLAQHLGLLQGTTPALAERVARYQAEAGATQRQTLQRLRQQHGVAWGVKKLRHVTATLATALDEQRHDVQVAKLLELLTAAAASRGRHKPVLSVGRDGITLGVQLPGCHIWEVASTGTVSVLDRRGRRLGTVYLAYAPEPGQGTMSRQLTRLLTAVLERWQGPEPRLCYVTDAGDNETTYYDKVLRQLRHPRTREPLDWIRVLDYYHASERLWTMAAALFGSSRASWAWARQMQKWLLQPGGISRVLHSAVALRRHRGLRGPRAQEFRRAYHYLRERLPYLRYAAYRRLGLPLGSGVTEAACKTVYTQRLKLSGMRWQKAGAQTILNLRVLLLSGVWTEAYERTLHTFAKVQVLTNSTSAPEVPVKVA